MTHHFSERQIEANIASALKKSMPENIKAMPSHVQNAMLEAAIQTGMHTQKVREAAILRLSCIELALSVGRKNDTSRLTPEAQDSLKRMQEHRDEDEAYLRNKYGNEGQPSPAQNEGGPSIDFAAHHSVLERGKALLEQMNATGEVTQDQIDNFVTSFLALPGQKDDIINAFMHAQSAMQTTSVNMERARNEYRAAKEKYQQAEANFIAAEEFLRQTLTFGGETVEGDEATRVLTGTKMQVRATKGEEGILYAVLEKTAG